MVEKKTNPARKRPLSGARPLPGAQPSPVADSPDYRELVGAISGLMAQVRIGTARTVNAVITATYWLIGRRIVEFGQGRAARAEYGIDGKRAHFISGVDMCKLELYEQDGKTIVEVRDIRNEEEINTDGMTIKIIKKKIKFELKPIQRALQWVNNSQENEYEIKLV